MFNDIKVPLKLSNLLLPSVPCKQTWTDAVIVIRSASLLNDSFLFSLDQIRPSTN